MIAAAAMMLLAAGLGYCLGWRAGVAQARAELLRLAAERKLERFG